MVTDLDWAPDLSGGFGDLAEIMLGKGFAEWQGAGVSGGRYISDAIALAERSTSNGGGFETRPYQFLQHKRETSTYEFVPPELERYRVSGGNGAGAGQWRYELLCPENKGNQLRAAQTP